MSDTPETNVAAPVTDAPPANAQAATPTPPTESKQPDLSATQAARLRFLLDKDKEIQKKAQDLKLQEQKVRWADNLVRLKQEDPLEALQQLGLSPQELSQRLQASPPSPTAHLEQKISLLAERLEESQKREEEYRLKAVMEEAQKGVIEYVKTSKDKYPLVVALGAESEVFKTIRERYHKEGVVMSEDEAASELEKMYEGLRQRLSGVNGNVTAQPVAMPPSATLTNSMQSQPAPKRKPEELSADERAVEAAKMLKFEEAQ